MVLSKPKSYYSPHTLSVKRKWVHKGKCKLSILILVVLIVCLIKGSGGCSEEEVLVAVPATAVLTNGLFIEQVFTMIFLEPGAR